MAAGMANLANHKSLFANDGYAKHLPLRSKQAPATTWLEELALAEQSLTIIENMLDAEEQSRAANNRVVPPVKPMKRFKRLILRNGAVLATFLITVLILVATIWLRYYRPR